MTVFIFTGPTLSPEEGREVLDAVYLPPAGQGDVYRATLDRPRAIGIIDGYFEHVPSVWHKEILWAMSQGIHVFGSASMGALRAAELEVFGMVGVGSIFEAFQSGALEDDDEVAVAHGSVEHGYRATSEAMVNLRATLEAAVAQGAIRPETRDALVRDAKRAHYADRCYPLLFAAAAREGCPEREVAALRAFVQSGRVNQKRADALAMLSGMREHLDVDPGRKQVRYTFEHTDTWEELRRQAGQTPAHPGLASLQQEALVEELQIAGAFAGARDGALVRALAVEEAKRNNRILGMDALRRAMDDFRRRHGLFEQADFERWRESNRLEGDDALEFFREEAHVRWFRAVFDSHVGRHLVNHLRATGLYDGLAERAREKARTLTEVGREHPSLADVGVTEDELWRWYFDERLEVPRPPDVARYAASAGFADVRALRRSALRELLFLRERGARDPGVGRC